MYKLYTSACYGNRSSLIDGTLIRLRLGLSAANRRAAQSERGWTGAGFVRSCWHSSRFAVWDSLESAWRPELPCRGALLFFREKFPTSMRGVRHKTQKALLWARVWKHWSKFVPRLHGSLQRDYSQHQTLSLIDANDCEFTVNMRRPVNE